MSRFFGPIFQSGYVVEDWEAAARHWIDRLGVGPFFVLRNVEFSQCLYRGEPTDADVTVALAFSGEHQIELVQQHNVAPSIYTDFLERSPYGLQHVGALTTDLDLALDSHGLRDRRIQWGETAAGQRFAYVDTVLTEGTMLELIEADRDMLDAFAHMRRAAADWDGSKPIRG
jgi:hypothetical protein